MAPAPDTAIDAASIGEVAWVDESGTPRAAGVLPLVREGQPVLALTFDRTELAVGLAGAREVDLVFREPRNTTRGWSPAAWRCTTRLVEDVSGDVYADELLLQELRRYPPARRYADSPMLMREYWWYLPRLLVELDPVAEMSPPAARSGSDDLLLVTVRDGSPVTGGASAAGGMLRSTWGPDPATGSGVVFDQDATFPDMERWDTWSRPVDVTGMTIVPREPLPGRTPVRMPGLRARWRAERRFAWRCRRGLDAWQT